MVPHTATFRIKFAGRPEGPGEAGADFGPAAGPPQDPPKIKKSNCFTVTVAVMCPRAPVTKVLPHNLTTCSVMLDYLLNNASGPRAGLPGPVLAANLTNTDQNPVPNSPGLRPAQCGIGFWLVRAEFPAKTGPKNPARGPDFGSCAIGFRPKPAQKTLPGDRILARAQ